MIINYRYGLYVNGDLIGDFPDTIKGFQDAYVMSKELLQDGDEHEIKAFEVCE